MTIGTFAFSLNIYQVSGSFGRILLTVLRFRFLRERYAKTVQGTETITRIGICEQFPRNGGFLLL